MWDLSKRLWSNAQQTLMEDCSCWCCSAFTMHQPMETYNRFYSLEVKHWKHNHIVLLNYTGDCSSLLCWGCHWKNTFKSTFTPSLLLYTHYVATILNMYILSTMNFKVSLNFGQVFDLYKVCSNKDRISIKLTYQTY